MRWEDYRRSDNIEARRGFPLPMGGVGSALSAN